MQWTTTHTPRLPRHAVLESLYDSIREGVYLGTLGTDNGTTIGVNPHLKLMFGFAPEVPVDAVQPFAPDRFVDALARDAFMNQLHRDGAVSDYLLRLRRADDSPIWVEVTATLHPADGEKKARLDALVRDVSERRKLEDQGRDISHQLLQGEKLAALGQTVSGVAHELNNPLATILTWAERLAARPVDADTRRGLETILSESERAAKIVRTLLTFARKRNTTRALVDLNEIVRETLALRTYDQRVSNIATVEALASGLPHVFADSHQVKQVLLNLVINAEQAMLAANGRGTLVARTWFDATNEMVMLEINDDGPGVPKQVQTKIFEPFFTTKAVGKGTGLGLTVVYAIVQEHGGQIRIGSNPGGASFFVSFPATTGTLYPLPAQEQSPPPASIAGAAVLVVEDEPALAAAVAEALTDAGYRVDCAGDGQEALEHIRSKVFDLVVCDLKMPRLDGPSFYRVLAQIKPKLARHVLFVTGDVAGTETERFLIEAGCRWLPKPFRLNDLLRVASEVVAS
jgi:signal transduction histidine kinase